MPRRGGNHASPAAERRRRVVKDLKVSEIKAELKSEGIEFESRTKKDDLVELFATRGRVREVKES